MLISMPTGTSTIFGVFQAILALSLRNRTNSALANKVVRNQKFASKIFIFQRYRPSACCDATNLVAEAAKPMKDQWVLMAAIPTPGLARVAVAKSR
jgi:hypothetical protein